MVVAVEGVASVAAFELDRQFHPLVSHERTLGMACVHVVESNVWFGLYILFVGRDVGRIERADTFADRVGDPRLSTEQSERWILGEDEIQTYECVAHPILSFDPCHNPEPR